MEPVPTEMTERDPMEMALSIDVTLDNVLKHLKVPDLLRCRKVSKLWNRAASSVLRKRSTMIKFISSKEKLMRLQECMESSLDFPFAGLRVRQPQKLNSGDAKEFFEKYGDRFTRLCLDTRWPIGVHDLAPFIILLPRLSILEVDGHKAKVENPRLVELEDSAAGQEDGLTLKLPSVRIIRILSGNVGNNILQAIVTAASPSVQIECLDANYGTFRALRSVGKLQAISFLKLNVNRSAYGDQFMRELNELLPIESPSLTKMEFTGDDRLWLDGMGKTLVSSQHTLKELHIDGQLFSKNLWENLPVLAKLTRLSLGRRFSFESLFRGENGNIFPALNELHLDFENNKGPGYSSGSFVVPSVTRIDLRGYLAKDRMEQLAQSFPNVVDIRLDYSFYNHPNSFEIWSVGKFRRLEKLRIWNVTDRQPTEIFPSMDSFLTGMPVEICKYLHEQMQPDLVDSPQHEVVRNNPSILQLENLKELLVCVQPWSTLEPEGRPFISMVSVKYALDMMPNLRAEFVFECPSSRSEEEHELVKAKLEAAFKHVHPSVKLEPFFY